MRKLLISAIMVSTMAVAAPAMSQSRGGFGFQGGNIERQLDQIEQRIDRARDRRLVSNREARRLSREAEQIDRLHDRYSRNGLNRREFAELQDRVQNLRQRLQFERAEGRGQRW